MDALVLLFYPIMRCSRVKNELCVGSGPGATMQLSTKIIGSNQFETARTLYETATAALTVRSCFVA
jgi:hypothetical protein